jgi:hypothetical protein
MSDDEFASNLLLDAIDKIHQSQTTLSQLAQRCAGWSITFSRELDQSVLHAGELIAELEALLSEADNFDDAHDLVK